MEHAANNSEKHSNASFVQKQIPRVPIVWSNLKRCKSVSGITLMMMVNVREHPEVYKPLDDDEDDYEETPSQHEPVLKDKDGQTSEGQTRQVYSAAEASDKKSGKQERPEEKPEKKEMKEEKKDN